MCHGRPVFKATFMGVFENKNPVPSTNMYFCEDVWKEIMSYLPPVKSEPYKVYTALNRHYKRGGSKKHPRRQDLITFTRDGNKRRKLSFCRLSMSNKRGWGGTRDAEALWFLQHGFESHRSCWEYYEKGSCVVRIEKGILHAIHCQCSWYDRSRSREKTRKKYFRYYGNHLSNYTYRQYRRVSHRLLGPAGYYPFNKHLGYFAPL